MAGACIDQNGYYDIYVLKVDAEGNFQWSAKFDGAGSKDDMAVSIAVDDNDDIYITGMVYTSTKDSIDCITIKYNPSGTKLWHALYNGNDSNLDFGTGILVDNNYNVYVIGGTTSNTTLLDVLIVKYDDQGNQLWVETFDNSSMNDISTSIALIDNHIFITGGFQSSVYNWDYGILKYNEDGNFINSQINGSSGQCLLLNIF